MIRDLIQVRPQGGNLTDRDLKKLSRMWRQRKAAGDYPATFYVKPSEKRRQKRRAAEFRRKKQCP